MSTADCNSLFVSAENRARSNVKVDKVTYAWTVDNFDFWEARGTNIQSPLFSASTNDEVKWFLELKPNGEAESKDDIGLYLKLSDISEHKTVFAKDKVSILNEKGIPIVSRNSTKVHKYVAGDEEWGWKNFCKKDENFRKSLLPNNVLNIFYEVTFSIENNEVIEHHHSRNSSFLKSTAADFDITENLGILLNTHLLSDVVISVKNKDFPAHKSILAAGSKVFAAMFQHDTKENQQNRVEIEDMSEEMVSEMLRFIYVGKCEKLDELAGGLLAAADKYDLDRLKLLCSEALCKNLSIENAASVLLLADMHNANELKNEVIKFIVDKPTEVFATADWKDVLSNSGLIGEVFQAMARR